MYVCVCVCGTRKCDLKWKITSVFVSFFVQSGNGRYPKIMQNWLSFSVVNQKGNCEESQICRYHVNLKIFKSLWFCLPHEHVFLLNGDVDYKINLI